MADATVELMTRASFAEFSQCTIHQQCASPSCSGRLYRYLLRWPTGLDNDRVALLIAANPSTADATQLDPTLTRWRNYCYSWGYGWSWTVNIRAWRATNPKDVPRDDTMAMGPENVLWIQKATRSADLIVCGWGKLGGSLAMSIARNVPKFWTTKPLHALRVNRDGSPAHPLYLPATLMPVVWTPRMEEP